MEMQNQRIRTPRITKFMRVLMPENLWIGIMIDGCVARLKKYKPEEYELIIAHFVIGISLRAIAKKRKCSDGTVRKDLQTAIGFVDGCICMLTI